MAQLTLAGRTFSPERPGVIVPLYGTDRAAVAAQARAAGADPDVDLAELRLDALPPQDMAAALQEAAALCAKPLILTLRTRAEGGGTGSGLAPAERLALLRPLLQTGKAAALDIEWSDDADTRAALCAAARAAGAVPLFSWHDFTRTPPVEEMTALLTAMADAGAGIAKLAVWAAAPADAAALLLAAARAAAARPDTPLLAMAMGPCGAATRFAAPAFGSFAAFGCLPTASTAVGQPPAAALHTAFRLLNGAKD